MGITMDLREKQPWSQQMLDFIFKEIEKGALINTAATEPKTGSPTRGGKPETLAVKQKRLANQWPKNIHHDVSSVKLLLSKSKH